jgi:Fe-S cluster assembly ATP-binding protein
MLIIKDLIVSLDEKIIIKNLNLTINENEIHILMGPNGCGKSTLSKIIAGFPTYKINSGNIFFNNNNINNECLEIRALNGIFLGFQNPVEIQGVNNFDFLHFIYNEKCKFLGEKSITPINFLSILNPYLKDLNICNDFLNRNVNEGFSGGEKKKNEILQMLLLNPKLIILDEIDSGVDIDSLKRIFLTIKKYKTNKSSVLLITHSFSFLKYFNSFFSHLMINGTIIKTGKKKLIKDIEIFGYTKQK